MNWWIFNRERPGGVCQTGLGTGRAVTPPSPFTPTNPLTDQSVFSGPNGPEPSSGSLENASRETWKRRLGVVHSSTKCLPSASFPRGGRFPTPAVEAASGVPVSRALRPDIGLAGEGKKKRQ